MPRKTGVRTRQGMFRVRRRIVLFIIFVLVLPTPVGLSTSNAAEIYAVHMTKEPSWIFVEGQFETGDEKKFRDVAFSAPKALVTLKSDGGNLIAGIGIGKTIQLKGFETYIPSGVRCASACALAWLGSRNRAMSAGARVGFHAASFKGNGEITAAGNALIGAYLNQLGLPMSAVIYISETPPDQIRWLTFADALKHGINVRPYEWH